MLKDRFKDIVLDIYSKSDRSIIINSYGRSGSTVLTKSILESIVKDLPFRKKKFIKSSFSRREWDLNNINLKEGVVFKTHDYPPLKLPKGDFNMLYTFANPINVVESISRLKREKGMEWIKLHFEHLKVIDADIDNIENEDILKLEKHLDTWLSETRFPVMFLNYEKMWNYQSEIGKYLGFKLELPDFRIRKSKIDKENERYRKLENTYGSLINKIAELEDCFVING